MKALTPIALCCALASTEIAGAQSVYLTDLATFTGGLSDYVVEDFNAGPLEILPDGTYVFGAFTVTSNALAGTSVVGDRLVVSGASSDEDFATAFINFDRPVSAIGANLFDVSVLMSAGEDDLFFENIVDFAGATTGDFGVIEFSEPVTRIRMIPALSFSMILRIDNLVIAYAPNPCLADTNGDGFLTPADFSAWVAAFNAMAPACDQNGDLLCAPADFGAWVANFNAGC